MHFFINTELWLIPTLLLVLIELVGKAHSIRCFECDNEFGTCNEGECSGTICLKIDTTSGGKKSVQKGCDEHYEDPNCMTGEIVGYETRRCACNYDFCNSDTELVQSGLEESRNGASGDRSKRTNNKHNDTFGLSPNYLIMLIFLCLFITGSFSLLIMNTVCVHLC